MNNFHLISLFVLLSKNLNHLSNKDRLCEERTTILSIGWTSPAREQGLIYKQISFFECEAVEVRVGRVLFLGRAKALAFKEAKKMWAYIMKMVYSPVTELMAGFRRPSMLS